MRNSTISGSFLDCQQAANYLGVSIQTIRRWAQSGKLQGKKVGSRGDWRFTRINLDLLMQSDEDKYDAIKLFLLKNVADIATLAIEKHQAHLYDIGQTSKNLRKNRRHLIEIIQILANNLEDVTKGRKEFDKLSLTLAADSISHGLTIEEAFDSMTYLRRALLDMVEEADLLQGMTAGDFYALDRSFCTYKDIVTSRMAFAYQQQYTKGQEALGQSEEVFAKTFHASPVAMSVIRAADGVIVDVNDHYLRLLDYERSEVVGRTIADVNEEKGYSITKQTKKLGDIRYGMRRTDFEAEIRTSDGVIKQIRGAYVASKIHGEKHIIASHADVTERLASEETNRYLAVLTHNIADAVISLDKHSNITTWNKGAEKLYGWKESEVVGKRITSLLHTKLADKSLTITEVRKIIAEKGFWRGESIHTKKDGTTVDILSSVAAIRNEAGEHIGSVAVYRDNSDRKKAERALRDSESRYRVLFNSILAGFSIVEMLYDDKGKAFDYRYIEVNAAFSDITGLENPVGKTVLQLTPGMPQSMIDRIAKVAETGKDDRFTEFHESQKRWLEISVSRVGGRKGHLVALLVRDVTEKLSIENERAASTEKIINTLESISDAFYHIDANFNIQLVNEEFVRLVNISRNKLIGSNLTKLFPDYLAPNGDPYKSFQQALKTQEATNFVEYYDELQRWAEIRVYPTEGGLSVFIRDITQQKTAEEKQTMLDKLSLEREELLKISKVKDEFIGIASHQLRTPATGVKQYIGLLLAGFGGPLSDRQQNYLETAYASNERQIKLINDLLKTAQLDADTYTLYRRPNNIGGLLRKTVSSLQSTFDDRHQTVDVNDLSDGTEVEVDGIEMDLVFTNLLENASKYSPEKSNITVSLRREAATLVISIADEGIGISQADQGKIFDKFTRAANGLPDTVSGTGLGLYWAKQIIQLHNGTITVSSKPNEGSTFTVTLPI